MRNRLGEVIGAGVDNGFVIFPGFASADDGHIGALAGFEQPKTTVKTAQRAT